jgi:hypothetical protein
MGTFKVSRLAPDEIVSRYQAGETMGLLSLRARMPMGFIKETLLGAGVAIRTSKEAVALASQYRPKPRRALPRPPGSNPWGRP